MSLKTGGKLNANVCMIDWSSVRYDRSGVLKWESESWQKC